MLSPVLMDHEIGSIVAGKRADLTVFESDPMAVGAVALAGIGKHPQSAS